MRLVHKYGGTSLEDAQCIRRAAEQTAAYVRQGHQVVVVVSAQGQTTDLLLEKAAQLHPGASAREMDGYLAAGEQMSAGLMAMALEAAGCPAVSLTGWQAGIVTDSCHGSAAIVRIDPGRLEGILAQGQVAVVAGFQGVDEAGDITTLGRGGSDTTAVALAAALKADRCRIYTDVDGVYDADPRRCPGAKRYDRIGYEEMLRLVRAGAQVLHRPCVELAREQGIALEVLSSFTGAPGTMVGDLE